MPKALFAWELGSGYSHVNESLAIALALRRQGVDVVFALRELHRAEPGIRGAGFAVLQAPIGQAQKPSEGALGARSLADILVQMGWRPNLLPTLVDAWTRLIASEHPDIVISDYAPTALLAAWFMGIPTVASGTGFFVPPGTTPLPSIRPWDDIGPSELADAEARAMVAVAKVAQGRAVLPPKDVGALFDRALPALVTWPGLDAYGPRAGMSYSGPLWPSLNLHRGAAPSYPKGGGPRVFAYLAGGYPGLGTILGALVSLGASVIVHVREAVHADVLRMTGGSIRYEPDPIDAEAAIAAADLVVSHASHGLSAQALRAGKPVVMFPTQQEQALTAYRLAAQGAGLTPRPGESGMTELAALSEGLYSRSYREAAQRMAATLPEISPQAAADALAARIATLA